MIFPGANTNFPAVHWGSGDFFDRNKIFLFNNGKKTENPFLFQPDVL